MLFSSWYNEEEMLIYYLAAPPLQRVLNVNSFCNQICGSWTNSFENWSRKKICNGWLYLYITRVLHCSGGSCNFEFLLDKFCRIYSVIMFKLSKFEDGAQHSLFGNNYFLPTHIVLVLSLTNLPILTMIKYTLE